jgi:hypothetical protein
VIANLESTMKSSSSVRLTLASLLALAVVLTPYEGYSQIHQPRGQSPKVDFRDPQALQTNLAEMPISFAENRGQTDSRVVFQIQGRKTAAYFTSQGVTLALAQPPGGPTDKSWNKKAASGINRWNLKLDFVGANPTVRPTGRDSTQAQISYFRGAAKDWRTGIRTYSSVVYSNLWPGIDLVYSGTVNRLKYEFIVQPGADPRQIRMAYRGSDAPLAVRQHGELEISTPLGVIRDDQPVSHQGRYKPVTTQFVVQERAADGSQSYGFKVGEYDRGRTLVIDPAIRIYSGFIGGNGDDEGHSIAVDGVGNAYVTGITTSAQATFPETAGPDLIYNGPTDAFIAKIRADGTGLVYAGYIGGDGDDAGHAVAIDTSGNAYVTGWTTSTEASFPVQGGPDLVFNGVIDAFVAKINPTGTGLVYCGYVGGDEEEEGFGIAVDSTGRAYLTGLTASSEATFPKLIGPGLTFKGVVDAFVARVKADGSALEYAGYLGGAGDDQGRSIAIDSSGNAYVAGLSSSTETTFPMVGTLGPSFSGNTDAFVAKINSTGAAITYSGYIGGTGIDEAYGIAVDTFGSAYLTGRTTSTEATFPKAVGPDLTFNGGIDAFVAKVNPAGSALVYAGYIGGSGDDEGFGIAVDGALTAHVVGRTTSTEATFPKANAFDLTLNGPADAFFAKVSATGTALTYAGYVGGSGLEEGFGIAINGLRRSYVTGRSTSEDGSFSTLIGPGLNFAGISDAFAVKYEDDGVIEYEADVAPRPTGSGTLVVSDWVQVGRFSVGLDVPSPGYEAQRADCAPRSTLGDGQITVADWVQAGRYSVSLDPPMAAGGPSLISQFSPGGSNEVGRAREIRIASHLVTMDENLLRMPVELVAQGGENGLTFSVQYDSSVLQYLGYERGQDTAIDTTIVVNSRQAQAGKIGLGIVARPGGVYAAGVNELVRIKFKVQNLTAGATEVRIGDGPIPLRLADLYAELLSVSPVNSLVKVNKPGVTIATPMPAAGTKDQRRNGLSEQTSSKLPAYEPTTRRRSR